MSAAALRALALLGIGHRLSQRAAHRRLDQLRVQGHRQRGDFANEFFGAVAGAGAFALRDRVGNLRDESRLTIRGDLERAQMPGFHAVIGEGRSGFDEPYRVLVEESRGPGCQ